MTQQFRTLALAAALAVSAGFISCKGTVSDEDIRSEVTKKLDDEAGKGVTASVSNGVVTLSGTCKDAECKNECAEEVKGVKGVKSVVNNIAIPEPQVSAPVEITSDEPLQAAVNDVLKNYSSVKADVNDGVIKLKGEVKRDVLPALTSALHALKPKSVDNSELKIKN